MRKGLKKVLCGLLAGLMVAVTIPAALPETSFVTEVQAATKLATPKLVYAKPSGKNKILLKWKAVKGASGYRIYRRADGSAWKPLGNVNGIKKVVYTDTKTTTGVRYTYTVKAFKKVKGKYSWSGYDKKGLTTVAGLSTLKLNRSKVTLYTGKSYTLRINGTKAVPTWKSSNTKVATVTKSGKITAKTTGKAQITATLYGRKLTCTVTVKKPSAAQTKLAQNYTKVKNYINKYGRYSEDGVKYVEMSIDKDTTVLVSVLTRENKLDMGLVLSIEEENIVSTIDVIANCATSDTVRVYSGLFSDETELYTKATMKASTYTGKQNIIFYNESGKKANTDIQKAANATLQAAMAGTEYFLQAKLHMSLKDLGFSAYKL